MHREFLTIPVLLQVPLQELFDCSSVLGVFEPIAKSKLAAERVRDQSATATLVEGQISRPGFAYFAETLANQGEQR